MHRGAGGLEVLYNARLSQLLWLHRVLDADGEVCGVAHRHPCCSVLAAHHVPQPAAASAAAAPSDAMAIDGNAADSVLNDDSDHHMGRPNYGAPVDARAAAAVRDPPAAAMNVDNSASILTCPFAACRQRSLRTTGAVLTHVALVYLSNKEIPPAPFLDGHNRRVCAACLTFVPKGRACSKPTSVGVQLAECPARLPPDHPQPLFRPPPATRASALDQPQPAASASILDIFSFRVPTHCHILRSLRFQVASVLGDLLRSLVHAPSWKTYGLFWPSRSVFWCLLIVVASDASKWLWQRPNLGSTSSVRVRLPNFGIKLPLIALLVHGLFTDPIGHVLAPLL